MIQGNLAAPSLRELTPRNDFTETASGPHVLVAYQDGVVALRALNVFASVVREAGTDADPQIALWRFDAFACPEWRETAALRAERADMVIVALSHDHELPPHVTSWIELWTRSRKPHGGALVAIFDSSREDSGFDIAVRLQTVVETAGLDFFCSRVEQADRNLQMMGISE